MVTYKCHSCSPLELFHYFVINKPSMKVYWGLKSLHLSLHAISESLELCWCMQKAWTNTACPIGWEEEGEIPLFDHLNKFLSLPHSFHRVLWYNGIHPHSWPLYKHAVVILNQLSETFTLLQSIDNDISHIYSILISVGHVVNTDKSPEPRSFTKGERRSK